MPLGKAYTVKDMTGVSKQGEMSPIPDGVLYREPLEKELLGPTPKFDQTTNVPSGPGSVHNQEKAVFAMAEDHSIYDESGK